AEWLHGRGELGSGQAHAERRRRPPRQGATQRQRHPVGRRADQDRDGAGWAARGGQDAGARRGPGQQLGPAPLLVECAHRHGQLLEGGQRRVLPGPSHGTKLASRAERGQALRSWQMGDIAPVRRPATARRVWRRSVRRGPSCSRTDPMHLGYLSTNSLDERPDALALALEERGYESLWLGEHTHIPVARATPYPAGEPLPAFNTRMLDPFVALMAAAVATSRLRVG